MSDVLLSCQEVRKAYGDRPLFEDLSFGIFEGDQVGLVGPNGSGKSTLLRILAGVEEPDEGTRSIRKRLRMGYVTQDPTFGPEDTVEAVLHRALAHDHHSEDYEKSARVNEALHRAGFDDISRTTGTLSGGYRKRLAIACELVRAPDLLLMDEPTNHLDVEGILWLEEVLRSQPLAFVVVSHDRYFLESVAKRMLELNRVYPEGLLDVAGTYSVFLTRKDELLQGQASYQESLANRVRSEVEWLSRKAKARTRKAQARIDEAGRLIQELADTRARRATSTADIAFTATQRKTRQLVVAEGVHRSFGDRKVLTGLDLTLSPGTRLGLLGPNGSGKTTLLRLLSGVDKPDAGTLEFAPVLRTVVFDQHRTPLDPTLSLRRSLAPDGDSVMHQGRAVHVAGWAKRFLFRAEQLETPVGRLSGGEQARVLIARLMLEPADLLLLDEPTNDLDIPTLEVLEEGLLEFPGALVLVTHDRYLLDRVSTQLLALDGKGGTQFFADLAQWEALQQAPAPTARPTPRNDSPRTETIPGKRLSYREKKEWEQMEAQILKAETRVETLREATHDPAVASDAAALHERFEALQAAEADVARLYARWAELEGKQG